MLRKSVPVLREKARKNDSAVVGRLIRSFLLSEHFCGTRLDVDDQALFLQKNMRIKIYLKPQSRANSSSSSGHSGTSLPEDITGFPISMALRFCSKDGNA